MELHIDVYFHSIGSSHFVVWKMLCLHALHPIQNIKNL